MAKFGNFLPSKRKKSTLAAYLFSDPVPRSHANIDWMQNGKDELEKALKMEKNENVAKNVVFFLGDGMGITNVFAARVYTGQRMGHSGEEYQFEFEKMDHVALSKVSCDICVVHNRETSRYFVLEIKI